jgi:hypothetical protein
MTDDQQDLANFIRSLGIEPMIIDVNDKKSFKEMFEEIKETTKPDKPKTD